MSLGRIPLQQLLALRASPNGDDRAPPPAVMTDGGVARVRCLEADLTSYACAGEAVGQQKHQREHQSHRDVHRRRRRRNGRAERFGGFKLMSSSYLDRLLDG